MNMGIDQKHKSSGPKYPVRGVIKGSKKFTKTRLLGESKSAFLNCPKNLLSELLENSPFPTLILDKNLKVIMANKKTTAIAAQASRKIVGRSAESLAREWLAKKDTVKFLKFLTQTNLTKRRSSQKRILFGNITPVQIKVKRIRCPNNKKSSYCMVSIKEEAELNKKYLEQNGLLGTASHELKTPLTAIKVFGQLANLSLDNNNSKTSKYLQKIDQEINRAICLIDNIFDASKVYFKKIKIERQENSLDKLIYEVLGEARITNPARKIKVSGRINRQIKIDRDKIKQVILNLLNNAIKYSPSDQEIEIKLKKNELAAQIAILDHGQGIRHEDLTKIFKQFYQGNKKNPNEGLGLGLYLSQKIVKEHGGNILVSSRQYKGSTFTVVLPFK